MHTNVLYTYSETMSVSLKQLWAWEYFFAESWAMCLAQGPFQVTHTWRASRVSLPGFVRYLVLELVTVPDMHAL